MVAAFGADYSHLGTVIPMMGLMAACIGTSSPVTWKSEGGGEVDEGGRRGGGIKVSQSDVVKTKLVCLRSQGS